MTDEQGFQDALDASPEDFQLRLVFADWLEDQGDERAAGIRALGILRRVPCSGSFANEIDREHYCNRHWICEKRGSHLHDTWGYMREEILKAYLPADWCDQMRGMTEGSIVQEIWNYRSGWHGYLPRREVEDLASLAFLKLSPERQSELLAIPVLC